ncbi:hypothetical protein O181_013447 [Austropuccinia psidii MF-1]|uniref:Neutral ceramidase n=1 Tax=Austropuccinia psidii MF-1 TaxID=1389203 RepID=A0A9Q3BZN1_9BASI|nr:hypothetical protein [Austropuccinia psidii MF-1]
MWNSLLKISRPLVITNRFQKESLGLEKIQHTHALRESPTFDRDTRSTNGNDKYLLGLGIGDITGPIVEIELVSYSKYIMMPKIKLKFGKKMGYANPTQIGTGLRMRLRSRAFIVGDISGKTRWVLVNSLSACCWFGMFQISRTFAWVNRLSSRGTIVRKPLKLMVCFILMSSNTILKGDTAIRRGVLEKLDALYPGLYGANNVALVGTHSHAGVAGFTQNLLPQITSKGFVKQNYDAIVNGTVLAIKRAHESLSEGSLSHGKTTLLDTNLNRSPYAYQFNPKEERARYKYDVDKDFDLIKFSDGSGKRPRGFMSWFAVHGTSLFRTLVASDNKGWFCNHPTLRLHEIQAQLVGIIIEYSLFCLLGIAAYLYESSMESITTMPGKNTFISGFFQSNVGDTTPNVLGAYCESGVNVGKLCSYEQSLCGNRTEPCQGRGPAFPETDWESNMMIGKNQEKTAKELMSRSLQPIKGGVQVFYTTIDMSSYRFVLPTGQYAQTCPPAMGYAFAGGTTDGAGAFDFYQGNNKSKSHQNPLWNLVGSAVGGIPSEKQRNCHAPKPILLNTGFANFPYDWSPKIVEIQMFKVGQLIILIVPGEFTTMAGRRLREQVKKKLVSEAILNEDAIVILTGPANTYTHYVATEEEYGAQRYEGASTIYGPKTLAAYIDLYSKYTGFLAENNYTELPLGPSTPDLREIAISLNTGILFDGHPVGKPFGYALLDVDSKTVYRKGDQVVVKFQGGNPRNDLLLEDSYLRIQTIGDGRWIDFRTDSHPSTTFEWKMTNRVLGFSEVVISWTIEMEAPSGTYRILYKGQSKGLGGALTPISGTSSYFTVG